MIISHYDTAKRAGESAHRPGGIEFVILLQGQEHSIDNYMLALVDVQQEFNTPRHRHNFEQVRIMLEGRMQFDPGQVQEQGTIGYFSEGTYYTQQGAGRSRTLLLQVAGPSGDGYMSREQMDAGVQALKAKGTFERGVFTWTDKAGTDKAGTDKAGTDEAGTDEAGQRHNKDGYEAIWEHVFGRPIGYEPPRYDKPVLLWPDRFQFIPDPAQPGVAFRRLGTFHERGLSVAQARLNAGASWELSGAERPWLVFVTSGTGRVGAEPFRPQSAWQVERGETVRVLAETTCEFHILGLPVFDGADLPATLRAREPAMV